MEDRVLSQQEIGERPRLQSTEEFSRLLQYLRDERGISKADLAKRTGFDPSTITRFEQGNRVPDRDSIQQLSDAMVLPLRDRDKLLAAAGLRSVLWDDPLLVELADVLVDPSLTEDVRTEVRSVVRMAVRYARAR